MNSDHPPLPVVLDHVLLSTEDLYIINASQAQINNAKTQYMIGYGKKQSGKNTPYNLLLHFEKKPPKNTNNKKPHTHPHTPTHTHIHARTKNM